MLTFTTFLSNYHTQCDNLFVAAENAVNEGDWPLCQQQLQAFCIALEQHLSLEEKILFPAFEQLTGITAGPTQVMCIEHEQMRATYHQLLDAAKQRDVDGYLGLSETLLILMQQHNFKEENVLYPLCDDHLSALQKDLLAQMQAMLSEENHARV